MSGHPRRKKRPTAGPDSLYFDEDYKRLRKERMERERLREEQEGELRKKILKAQADELQERILLHRQLCLFYKKAGEQLDKFQGGNIILPPFPVFHDLPTHVPN